MESGPAVGPVRSFEHIPATSDRAVPIQVVALRVELSITRLSAASGQPALDYPLSSGTLFGLVFSKKAVVPDIDE